MRNKAGFDVHAPLALCTHVESVGDVIKFWYTMSCSMLAGAVEGTWWEPLVRVEY